MITIQSQKDESTTDDVLDWLYYLGADHVMRVNGNPSLNRNSLRINNHLQKSNLFDNTEGMPIAAYWYRRGNLKCDINDALLQDYSGFAAYFEKEYDHFIKAISQTHKLCRHINSSQDNYTNKLANLISAAHAGLTIPDTIVTANVTELKTFASLYPQIITKAIGHNRIEVPIDNNTYVNIAIDTAIFDENAINSLADSNDFLPSIFQQYLEKRYELRIFYFHNRIYSMAIFSQLNEETKLDFRKHDATKPNRCVPYQLPENIEVMLRRFMNGIGMSSGSIDMVVTPFDEYVFLEVNPVGQLQWLSANCNYPLEKKIAKFLLDGK